MSDNTRYVTGNAGAAIRYGYAVQRDGDGNLEEWDGTGPFLGICEVAAAAAGDPVRCVRSGLARIKLAASQTLTAGDSLTLTSAGLAEAVGAGDLAYAEIPFSRSAGVARGYTTAGDVYVDAIVRETPDHAA